jgi:hypothetical protein
MWSAVLDKERQLLQIRFAQRVNLQEAKACAGRVEELLADLLPNFSLLNDLSELEEMDVSCEPVIDRMMDVLNRHGIKKVVRVVPEPRKDIGFGIMSLFHYGPRVRVMTCKTLAEAQQQLPA